MAKQANEGHRQRMLARFEHQGMTFDGFAPHEALEAFLFLLIARVNTNHTAHLLLERFGSLEGVFSAPISELEKVKGIGRKTAVSLRLYGELFGIVRRESILSDGDDGNDGNE